MNQLCIARHVEGAEWQLAFETEEVRLILRAIKDSWKEIWVDFGFGYIEFKRGSMVYRIMNESEFGLAVKLGVIVMKKPDGKMR